jgi:hypothetical protein
MQCSTRTAARVLAPCARCGSAQLVFVLSSYFVCMSQMLVGTYKYSQMPMLVGTASGDVVISPELPTIASFSQSQYMP